MIWVRQQSDVDIAPRTCYRVWNDDMEYQTIEGFARLSKVYNENTTL